MDNIGLFLNFLKITIFRAAILENSQNEAFGHGIFLGDFGNLRPAWTGVTALLGYNFQNIVTSSTSYIHGARHYPDWILFKPDLCLNRS